MSESPTPPGERDADGPDGDAPDGDGRWLTKGVAGVGLASFFSDSGHEIATAALPGFLSSTLHAGAGVLGVIEGLSDALTGLTKLAGGPLADRPRRRAALARGGYLVTALATGAIGAATAVWQVAVLRALAWGSRGVRSPSRDALLASLAPRHAYGRAFGVERAGDNLGAVAGPLLAALLVSLIGVRHAMYCAAGPGLLAAVSITFAAREARRTYADADNRARVRYDVAALRRAGIARPLVPIAMFEMGNAATTLLILRATELLHTGTRSATAAASLAIVVYAAHNAFAALVAYLAGHWLDRAGPRPVFVTGAVCYVAGYGLFAAGPHGWPALLAAFVLAGCGIGCAEPSESSLLAWMLPDAMRGSGFGVLGAVQAVGDLASSAAVGLAWSLFGPAVGFGYAAAWMLASAAMGLGPWLRTRDTRA
ncbi:MFS transporter [Streptantibioticus parmotrematis]|uniref:MFS transporter n=1 Tax=Streptantibioticus parmotrematis TaxID=2873249 RepID=UPI0033D00120